MFFFFSLIFFGRGLILSTAFYFYFAYIEFIIPRIVYGFGLYRKTGVETRYFWLFTNFIPFFFSY